MTNLIQKLKTSDPAFVGTALALSIAPSAGKLAVTGAIGPSAEFFILFAWVPLAFTALSAIRGLKSGLVAFGVFAAAFAYVALRYPEDPMMNFQRQFIHEGTGPMMVAALVVCALQVSLLSARRPALRSER
jgi:hypothetical protein